MNWTDAVDDRPHSDVCIVDDVTEYLDFEPLVWVNPTMRRRMLYWMPVQETLAAWQPLM